MAPWSVPDCGCQRRLKHWDEISRDIRPVYSAPTVEAAAARFEEFADKWGGKYPPVIRLWRTAWEEFIPFLDYDLNIRRIICTTNAIESLNTRFRRAIRGRGHVPNDQAARYCRASIDFWRCIGCSSSSRKVGCSCQRSVAAPRSGLDRPRLFRPRCGTGREGRRPG